MRARAIARSRATERAQGAAWVVLSLLGLMALLYAFPARAADEVAVDEGGTVVDVDAGGGMPSSNPRVRPILAAHPGRYVVICVAGCDGKPRAVQVLPGPVTARVGGFVPSIAKLGNQSYGPPRPAGKEMAAQTNDVVCVAGCVGRPGQVVQRISGLPPPRRAKALERKTSGDKRNEPLDINP